MRFNPHILDHRRNLPKPIDRRPTSQSYLNRAQRIGSPQPIVHNDLMGAFYRFNEEEEVPTTQIVIIPNLNLRVVITPSGAADRAVLRTQFPQLTLLNNELYIHYTLDGAIVDQFPDGEVEPEMFDDEDL